MGSAKPDKTLLSPRELEVKALRESGLTTEQIAEQLGLARKTVNKYLRSIRERATGQTGKVIHHHHYLDSQEIEEHKSKGIANTRSRNVTQVEQ